MRVIAATMLIMGGLVAAPWFVTPGLADPQTCPTVCDTIPDSAWIRPWAVPLDSTYHWPWLAGVAAPLTGDGPGPRFRFEELCRTPVFRRDSRDFAVAGRATVVKPEGQWQLQAQILHWRGDTARGGQNALSVFNAAAAALRNCQLGAPARSPSVTSDEPNRLAAVIRGPVLMHTYLVAHPQSSTISELTLWSSSPPAVPWPLIGDAEVLDAMTAPLCAAYIGSCPGL